jgi:hypothetical protein
MNLAPEIGLNGPSADKRKPGLRAAINGKCRECIYDGRHGIGSWRARRARLGHEPRCGAMGGHAMTKRSQLSLENLRRYGYQSKIPGEDRALSIDLGQPLNRRQRRALMKSSRSRKPGLVVAVAARKRQPC